MKLGILSLEVVGDSNEYFVECKNGEYVLVCWGPYTTYKSAFVQGVEKLKEKVLELQEELNQPHFRQKSEPVHVEQWWPCLNRAGVIKIGDAYWCHAQRICTGDWIVGDKIVTNEEFERDYEVIQ